MPIICFEGASAVGKSSTAEALKTTRGAFVVGEVHELFPRPQDEPPEWYFERQVERWAIAQQQSRLHGLVILDGDPFQPLWYNWSYNFAGWQDLNFMERFYRPKIRDGAIRFPDAYFIFSASEDELRGRRERDATRRRRGFEKHLRMIEPQRRYFQAMQALSPRRVLFLEAKTIGGNIEFILDNVSAPTQDDETEPERLFDKLIEWLRRNEA